MEDTPKKIGKFVASITRANSQIRKDRAATILDEARMHYKRHIEDLEMQLKRLTRDQDAMLDIAPGTTTDLKMPTFDPVEFVRAHHTLTKSIYNITIEIAAAKTQYTDLFGDE